MSYRSGDISGSLNNSSIKRFVCKSLKRTGESFQPRGNMLLVGIGGSGRQSLSRISSYMCELNIFQISITKQYRLAEFREDLKTLYMKTGVDGKPCTFLFNDTQVVEEQFLEIVNNMLSTGEVTNLYKSDELEEVNRFLSIFMLISNGNKIFQRNNVETRFHGLHQTCVGDLD